jgi:hypothetical protein
MEESIPGKDWVGWIGRVQTAGVARNRYVAAVIRRRLLL